MSDFMKTRIDANCPECNSRLKVSIRDITRGATVRCRLGHSVKLEDKDRGVAGFGRQLKALEKSFDIDIEM